MDADSTTKSVAIIGLVTGSIGTLTGVTALAWDLYKWRHSGPRVIAWALPNNKIVPAPNVSYLGLPTDEKLVRIRVSNVGHSKTTIQAIGFAYFGERPNRRKSRPVPERFVVPQPYAFGAALPYELEPGGKDYNGFVGQTPEIEEMARTGYLYALIEHTLMGKRPVYSARILIDGKSPIS